MPRENETRTPRSLGRLAAALVVALLIIAVASWQVTASSPLQQDEPGATLDPEVRAALQVAVAEVAARLYDLPEPTPPPPAESPILLPTPTPQPPTAQEAEQPAGEAEPAPTEEPAPAPPPAETGEAALLPHRVQGVTLQVPTSWTVLEGRFGSLLNLAVPGTNFIGVLQGSMEQDLPGLLGVVVLRDQAQALVRQIDENGELIGVTTRLTSQQLPLVRIDFRANFQGSDGQGALYLVSPGATAYLLITFAPTAEWEALQPTVDLVAQSIFFDPFQITLTAAEGRELLYTHSDGSLSLTVPVNWQVTETGQEMPALLVADPSFAIVAAIGHEAPLPADLADELGQILAAAPQTPTLDTALLQALQEAVLSALNILPGELTLDEAATQAFVADGQVTIRLVGTTELEPGLPLTLIAYARIHQAGVLPALVFGDLTQILEREPSLLAILNTVTATP